MKPKGAYQETLVKLSANLPKITDEQKEWGYKKCLDFYALYLNKKLHCTECGHSWKDEKPKGKIACPSCGKSLELLEDYRSPQRIVEYFVIIDVVDGIQLVRTISVVKILKDRKVSSLDAREVMQHWINPDGDVTLMSLNVQGISLYFDVWIYNSTMEIRGIYSNKAKYRSEINPKVIYPNKKILPILKRNGFKGYFYGIAPMVLFRAILSKPRVETLLKAGQIPMMKEFISSDFNEKYWPSIKICIRNGYVIKDESLWEDYVDSLMSYGKDYLNPKYVCPVDLNKAHDRLVEKKKRIQKKEKFEKLKESIAESQIAYLEEKGKFFGLTFHKDNIEVSVIETVLEFMENGIDLGHCVFTSEYFKQKESLIFSAKVDNKPVETVEFSLTENKVVQARGNGNKASKYHSKIINLVNKNSHQINRRMSV